MAKYPELIIDNRKIGYDYDPLVIVEIGINHGGSIDRAIDIADAAINSGAEVIKHQTHVVEDEMSEHAKEIIPGNADISIYEIMDRCALSESNERRLKQHVESRGVIFISTPFSRAAANRLERMDVPAYKIGSGECNNFPLLNHIARFGKPIILSTGMNSIRTIQKAVNIFRKYKISYALLHCTNVYPAPDHTVRLGAMIQLQITFPDAVIGLSDHSIDNLACLGGVALGASILERHFIDDKSYSGPDVSCSMDPVELPALLQQSKRLKKMRGGEKGAVSEEAPTIAFAFASVVAIKEIEPGEILSENNLWVKRPGNGDYLAEDYEFLLGKIAKSKISAGEQIKKTHINGLENPR